MNSKKLLKIARVSGCVLVALCIGLYALVVWEGSSAREDAPVLEANVAQWLLHYTVPASMRALKSPVDVTAGSPDVEAGHQVYTQKCEICHAYDGGGKSEIGSGQYPRPPDLRANVVQRMSDGELFYHLKNGIRHTGMPGWTLPDRKLWQVSAYLRNLPKVAALSLPFRRSTARVKHGPLRWIGGLQGLPYRDLRSVEEDAHGKRGSRPSRPPGGHHPGPHTA